MSIPKELKYITIFLACVLLVSIIIKPNGDYNCSDFKTQSESLKVFKKNKIDVYRLDRDGDGLPCETLPTN